MSSTAAQDASNVTTTTTEPTSILHPVLKHDLKFLIIPLIVILLVMILSALVYLMAKRRRLELVRETLLHLYDFDSNEQEWETPLLNSEDNYGSYKDYSFYKDYSSTVL